MIRASWCLTVSVDGELKTIFPGVLPPGELEIVEPVVRRAIDRRLRLEAAARAGNGVQPPASDPPPPAVLPPGLDATMTQAEAARVQGYEGDPCDACGQFRMKRSGHCLVCDACGTTTGCS